MSHFPSVSLIAAWLFCVPALLFAQDAPKQTSSHNLEATSAPEDSRAELAEPNESATGSASGRSEKLTGAVSPSSADNLSPASLEDGETPALLNQMSDQELGRLIKAFMRQEKWRPAQIAGTSGSIGDALAGASRAIEDDPTKFGPPPFLNDETVADDQGMSYFGNDELETPITSSPTYGTTYPADSLDSDSRDTSPTERNRLTNEQLGAMVRELALSDYPIHPELGDGSRSFEPLGRENGMLPSGYNDLSSYGVASGDWDASSIPADFDGLRGNSRGVPKTILDSDVPASPLETPFENALGAQLTDVVENLSDDQIVAMVRGAFASSVTDQTLGHDSRDITYSRGDLYSNESSEAGDLLETGIDDVLGDASRAQPQGYPQNLQYQQQRHQQQLRYQQQQRYQQRQRQLYEQRVREQRRERIAGFLGGVANALEAELQRKQQNQAEQQRRQQAEYQRQKQRRVANQRQQRQSQARVSSQQVKIPKAETTTIQVRVYELFGDNRVPLLWHTGTVIGGREYSFAPIKTGIFESFSTPGHVTTAIPAQAAYRRTITRQINGDARRVNQILQRCIANWNGKEYAVLKNANCNHFTDYLLQSLGTRGLDREYLRHGGIRVGLGAIQNYIQQKANMAKGLGGQISAEYHKRKNQAVRGVKDLGGKASEKLNPFRRW